MDTDMVLIKNESLRVGREKRIHNSSQDKGVSPEASDFASMPLPGPAIEKPDF